MEKNASKFNKKFIRNYDKESGKGYIFEKDVKYPKRLHNFHSDLPFLPERMKINKCNKLVCNLIHIRSLKQALNHGLVLKKVHKVIKLNQKAWLKPYIDMNTKLRTEAKTYFEKNFLS